MSLFKVKSVLTRGKVQGNMAFVGRKRTALELEESLKHRKLSRAERRALERLTKPRKSA